MLTYRLRCLRDLKLQGESKGRSFEQLEGSFDYSVPQPWLDEFSEWCKVHRPAVTYNLILSTTVWKYPENRPMTVCLEVKSAHDAFEQWQEMPI